MNVEEAIKAYTDKFGGFPYFLFLSAPNDKIVESVESALENDKEIEAEDLKVDY